MMREGLLWLSRQQGVFDFVRGNALARQFARRFVAGETIDQAVQAALDLRSQGITTTLDLLGESVTQLAEAEAAASAYIGILERMAAAGLEVNASVKLTQLGLDIDEARCAANVAAILDAAARVGGFVRLDMESSEYTQRTLDFFRREVTGARTAHCGVVLQSALRRTEADVAQCIAEGIRVRLVKGAYLEPPSVAYPDKADVDAAFVRSMEQLLARGRYPAIATHDEAIIAHARAFAERERIAPDRFEFQMLYGVRRDLQQQLRAAGWRVRAYVPYGTQWYPYLMRRLAERPANIAFILGSVAREAVNGR